VIIWQAFEGTSYTNIIYTSVSDDREIQSFSIEEGQPSSIIPLGVSSDNLNTTSIAYLKSSTSGAEVGVCTKGASVECTTY